MPTLFKPNQRQLCAVILGAPTHGKLGPQALSFPDPIGYHQNKIGWWSTFTKKGKEP
jgi:hypothetical protein